MAGGNVFPTEEVKQKCAKAIHHTFWSNTSYKKLYILLKDRRLIIEEIHIKAIKGQIKENMSICASFLAENITSNTLCNLKIAHAA